MIHILQSRQRLRMPLEGQTYCWWKNSGDHQLIGSYLQGFLYIPGGCFGFQKTINCMLSMWFLFDISNLDPIRQKGGAACSSRSTSWGSLRLWQSEMKLHGIGDPRWPILRFRSRRKRPASGDFFRSFFIGMLKWMSVVCWNAYFQKWRKMSNSWVTKTVWRWICKSCILRRPDTKATPWKDLRSDLCEILTLKARFMTSSNLLSTWYETDPKVLPVWQFGWSSLFFFAKRPFTSTQVKPRLASLEKEVTRSNFSSHQ